MGSLFIGLILMIGVFYFVLMRGNRKQQKERRNLLDNLKKNDRVMTIGGVVGTVVSVREHEVVVKVDESTNTKMTFIKKAIQQVITDGDLAAADK
jgi:preprotein translocase subunit YajC